MKPRIIKEVPYAWKKWSADKNNNVTLKCNSCGVVFSQKTYIKIDTISIQCRKCVALLKDEK